MNLKKQREQSWDIAEQKNRVKLGQSWVGNSDKVEGKSWFKIGLNFRKKLFFKLGHSSAKI